MKKLNYKSIICNKQAYHKYNIVKELECGIALLGWEVKSARLKTIMIDKSYISFNNKEAYIYNSIFQSHIIQHFQSNYNPTRNRKLLLKKHELSLLTEQIKHPGYTITILELYWKASWIKARIGIAIGKKKYDKRHIIDTHQWKNEKMKIIRYTNK